MKLQYGTICEMHKKMNNDAKNCTKITVFSNIRIKVLQICKKMRVFFD